MGILPMRPAATTAWKAVPLSGTYFGHIPKLDHRLLAGQPSASAYRAVVLTNRNCLPYEGAPMSAEARVAELGLELPEAPAPGGNYTPMVQVGDICYVSGHGPLKTDGEMLKGRVGSEVSEEDGYAAARQVGLAMLATLRANLGSLDRVKRVVKVLGMVNAAPDFETHPKVMNGFSDLMVEVFGDPGRAARSAIGMGSLPGNISVEVEAIVQVTE